MKKDIGNVKFLERKKENEELEKLFFLKKPNALLIGVKGRRRVGKTTFVSQFIEKKKHLSNTIIFDLILTAIDLKPQKEKKYKIDGDFNLKNAFSNLFNKCISFNCNLEIFSEDILKKISKVNDNKKEQNWDVFFDLLNEICSILEEKNIKCFLFFDEICWFSKKNEFILNFQLAWNNKLFFRKNLVLFFAGSNIGWMNNQLFENKKEFYNRIDLIVDIKPFSFLEINHYLKTYNKFISKRDVIFYYLMFGGIVKYYSQIDLTKTFEENFKMFLTDELKIKLLKKEKEILFESLFTEKKVKETEEIIFELTKSKTLSGDKLFERVLKNKNKNKSNSERTQLYRKLSVLLESEIIIADDKISHKSQSNYLINDLFSYFFYYWFDEKTQRYKNVQNGIDNAYFDTWKGIAFEIFVLNQLSDIFLSLGYESNCLIDKNKYLNYQFEGTTNNHQIDLLLTGKKQNWFVEVKNYNEKWVLGLSETNVLKKRIEDFNIVKNEDFIKQNVYFIISLLGSENSNQIKEDFGFIRHIKVLDLLN